MTLSQQPSKPTDQTCNVWWCTTDVLQRTVVRQAVWAVLPEEERRAVLLLQATPKGAARAQELMLSRALCRRALSAAQPSVSPQDWSFGHKASGAPYLRGRPGAGEAQQLQFSLSHTAGMVVCGVATQGCIGVDVEALDRPVGAERIARRLFGAEELAYVMARPAGAARQRAFLTLWTLKEAYLKSAGLGLMHLTSQMAFCVHQTGDVQNLCPAIAGQSVYAQSRRVAGRFCVSVVLACAVEHMPQMPVVQLRQGWV